MESSIFGDYEVTFLTLEHKYIAKNLKTGEIINDGIIVSTI
jgi:hypothetical protein